MLYFTSKEGKNVSLKKFFMPFSHSCLYTSIAVVIFSSLNIPLSNYCHTIKKTFRMEKSFATEFHSKPMVYSCALTDNLSPDNLLGPDDCSASLVTDS